MMASALLIDLTGGRVETHFHVFGSLAFLAFYRDWRVLATATFVVATSHFLQGLLWPMSIYGVPSGTEWRWLEHAGWVLFLDVVLLYGCRQSRREMRAIAERQVQLEEMKDSVEQKVLERTAELAASEMRFRTLSMCAPVGIYQADAAGVRVYANERLCHIVGISPQEALGDGWTKKIHPDDRESTTQAWQRMIETGNGFACEHRFQPLENKTTWVYSSAVALRDESGTVTGYIGSVIDITDQKQSEEKIHRAYDELAVVRDEAVKANFAKSEFLANMSHEIRTPMNGVLGMTELVLDTDLNVEQRESLDLVKSSAESLLVVIDDILDFSKIEAGKLELDPVEFELHDLIGDTLKTLALRAHGKGLELTCDIGTEVPHHVIGDPHRLRQIIVNLVGNAIKFTECGEVVVHTLLKSQSSGACRIAFSVEDTGIGIPLEKQEAIFDPFAQADGSTTRRYGGTGLGLSISSQLVSLMGGHLQVSSRIGLGSTFSFEVEFPKAGSSPMQAPEGTVNLRGMPVLVVDDNATNRRIFDGMLRQWGALPTIVAGGEASLAELYRAAGAGKPYPLLLVDAMMPEMDGFMLVERIRQDPTLYLTRPEVTHFRRFETLG